MSMLLEDLAEETSLSNERAADRLNAEARTLEAQGQAAAELQERRERAVELARQSTAFVLARVPQAEGIWESALAGLRKTLADEDAKRLLRSLLRVFESWQRLVRNPRALWDIAERLGAKAERREELERAEARFQELVREANLALEHRNHDWQPSDPGRLALGLKLARQGKTVPAGAARERFGRSRS